MKITKAEELAYRAVRMGELEIDDQGMIWRVSARRWNRWEKMTVAIPCRPRRAEHDAGAYLQVRVMIDLKRVSACAHRLVWRHFRGPIPDGLTINHKDGHKKRNHPDNLELATISQQALHAIRYLGWRPEKNFLG